MTKLIFLVLTLSVLSLSLARPDKSIPGTIPDRLDSTKYKTGLKLFKRNCAVCHAIAKINLIGPTLNGVEEIHDRAWITRFILDLRFRKQDSLAIEAAKKYSYAEHPDYGSELTEKDIALILDFIKAKVASGDLTISFKEK